MEASGVGGSVENAKLVKADAKDRAAAACDARYA
jgi:hypothetical protein